MEVEIWISGDQQDSFYKSIELKKVKILQNNEIDETIRLTHGIFPTYLITKNQKVVKLWTNQSFGARSLDEIEAFFKVHK